MKNASANKSAVEQITTNIISNLQHNTPQIQTQIDNVFDPKDADSRNVKRMTLIHQLSSALNAAQTERQAPSESYVSRDPVMGVVQSGISSELQSKGFTDANLPAGFQQFGPLDPEWAECVFASIKTNFEGKHAFVQHQKIGDFIFDIPDPCTIAIMADWGGDNHSALRISEVVKSKNPDYVIHLGDTYYAGTKQECAKSLEKWPLVDAEGKPKQGHSFALNGNHEMFSGAKFYFEALLAAFGKGRAISG